MVTNGVNISVLILKEPITTKVMSLLSAEILKKPL